MSTEKQKSNPQSREKLGFLLTLTLIWLCLQAFAQSLGMFSGIGVLLAAFRGEVSLMMGIGIFLAGIAIPALFILTIVFLFKKNRAFYVTVALCMLLTTLMAFLSKPIDGIAVAVLVFALLVDTAIWTLLFVSDTPRKRFGLPILHPRKKKPENTWS